MKVAQLLGLRGPWWHQVCRDMDCFRCRSYNPIRVFFQASCSWRSESLYGQSFSIVSPIQTLRGLPCLGLPLLFCMSGREGAPWLGSYSVVQCIRYLMGQPIVQFLMLACGERKAMVMAPSPTCDSAVSPCFHGCPALLHRQFLPQSPPSPPLDPSLRSQ